MMNVLLLGLLERLVTQLNIAHARVLVHTNTQAHTYNVGYHPTQEARPWTWRVGGWGVVEGMLGGDYPIHRNERITK